MVDSETRIGDKEELKPVFGMAQRQEAGVTAYSLNGRSYIAGIAPVALTGWSVIVTQDREEFLSPSRSIRSEIFYCGLIFLGITLRNNFV